MGFRDGEIRDGAEKAEKGERPSSWYLLKYSLLLVLESEEAAFEVGLKELAGFSQAGVERGFSRKIKHSLLPTLTVVT